MRWYVYVYYDEDHQPFYCGKGCGNRAYKAHDVPVPPRERMVFRYFDDEEQAFQLEKDLIAFWGRKDLDPSGRLMNICTGGPGAPGGSGGFPVVGGSGGGGAGSNASNSLISNWPASYAVFTTSAVNGEPSGPGAVPAVHRGAGPGCPSR